MVLLIGQFSTKFTDPTSISEMIEQQCPGHIDELASICSLCDIYREAIRFIWAEIEYKASEN